MSPERVKDLLAFAIAKVGWDCYNDSQDDSDEAKATIALLQGIYEHV